MNARVTVSDDDLARARREAGWTEHRVKIALALFEGGLSDAQCASLIGGVSRNAVIGMRNRRGITVGGVVDRPKHANANGLTPEEYKAARARTPADRIIIKARKPAAAPPPPIVDLEIPMEQRRSLLQLDRTSCRWPVGDPAIPASFFFCGAAKPDDDDVPYCRSHAHRAIDRRGGRTRSPEADPWRTKEQAGKVNNVWSR